MNDPKFLLSFGEQLLNWADEFNANADNEFKELIKRSRKVFNFLRSIFNSNVAGRELAKLIIQEGFIQGELLKEQMKEIIALPPGWCDMEGADQIPEEAFTVSSLLCVLFFVIGHLPQDFVPSPKQTINFKFEGKEDVTLIVDGSDVICFFHHSTMQKQRISLVDMHNHLQNQLQITLSVPLQLVLQSLFFIVQQVPAAHPLCNTT